MARHEAGDDYAQQDGATTEYKASRFKDSSGFIFFFFLRERKNQSQTLKRQCEGLAPRAPFIKTKIKRSV